jgi:D-methionine transport system substrate-binding protein
VAALGLVATIAACSSASADPSDPLRISASPVPHVQILQHLQDSGQLGDIKLDIVEITGDVDPNELLGHGDVDANYFQHVPYEKDWEKQHDVDNLANPAAVHVEPLGLYSKKVNDLSSVPDGATVALPNNVTNFARGLFLLAQAGLIKLDVGPKQAAVSQVTAKDVTSNPKHLAFTQIDPAQLPRTLDDGKVDLSVINGNYALEAGLKPAKDALELETAKGNPYANVLTVLKDDQDDPRVQALAKALRSKETARWIEQTYHGSVIPVAATK